MTRNCREVGLERCEEIGQLRQELRTRLSEECLGFSPRTDCCIIEQRIGAHLDLFVQFDKLSRSFKDCFRTESRGSSQD